MKTVLLYISNMLTLFFKELETFTLIKDTMRETCIPKLVDTWHHILVNTEYYT